MVVKKVFFLYNALIIKLPENTMYVVCLDLEGVVVPEIWISVAIKTGNDELKLTTRDISDYDVLMNRRIKILKEHDLTLMDIQKVISEMDPLPGAGKFLDMLREQTQVVILSDTFTQFASPLMRKLKWPVIFCNQLVTDTKGGITGYRLRQNDGKKHAVKAFHSMGMKVLAAGDSYNDLTMLREADSGILFCPPENIVKENPDLPAVYDYERLYEEITSVTGD